MLGFTRDPDSKLFDLMCACEERKLQVSVVPRFFEFVNVHQELEHLGGLPLFSMESIDPNSSPFAVKHAFDRVVAAIALLFLRRRSCWSSPRASSSPTSQPAFLPPAPHRVRDGQLRAPEVPVDAPHG